MPAVSPIQMQSVSSRQNSGLIQSGSTPDGTAMPSGFGSFLAALDHRANARGSAQSLSVNSGPPGRSMSLQGMQNLPISAVKSNEAANNADPMQLLMGQLAAQSMLTQALIGQNQATPTPQDPTALNPVNAAAPSGMQQLINSVGAQSLDMKQTGLIVQALSRALKASSGDGVDQQSGQAAQLLQAFQNQLQTQQANGLALNQAADQVKLQNNAQAAAQVAIAIQTQAQKNGITLPPELQAQLNALANQDASGTIKLLGVETDSLTQPKNVSSSFTADAGKLDPSKANTIQNVTDGKNAKVLGASLGAALGSQDKALKAKGFDGNLSSINPGEKSIYTKVMDPSLGSQTQVANDSASPKVSVSELSNSEAKSLDQASNGLSQPVDSTFNPNQAGLNRIDANLPSQHKIDVKASEISLTSGPVHAEILNTAKSGGGRIMFELTPPEQGTIRIDLRINSNGQAHLIVEGASDATKSRLDQGGQNLKNDFAQMGLNLSLDLRQGTQSQQMNGQAFGGNRQGSYSGQAANVVSENTAIAINSIGSGDNKGVNNTVHLYA